MNCSPTSLVLFDVDGTLLRGAGPHHKQALTDGIKKVTGRATTLDGIATAGTLDRDLIAAMLAASGASREAIAAELDAVVLACQESYLSNCASDLKPFVCPGVLQTLDALIHRGAILGLVTGNLSAIGWKKMELAGLKPYFTVAAFAEDGSSRAQLAKVAAERASQSAKRELGKISLVGDHSNDVAAAKANGFQSVAVATGVLPFEELEKSEPDLIVRQLGDLDLDRLFA